MFFNTPSQLSPASRPLAASARPVPLAFSPRVTLATGDICAVEAIQPLPPGRGEAFGGRVVQAACDRAASWPGMPVAVRLSGWQVQSGLLPAQVAGILRRAGWAAADLEVGVTEAVAFSLGRDTLLVLSALRELGVRVALDEFGARFGSLTLLRRLPLTAVKFSPALLPGPLHDTPVLRAAIEAADGLGLATVAMGVETEVQRAILSGLGCGAGEGALFGPMLPGPSFAHAAACGRACSAPTSPHDDPSP